jgi:hypothetical protein
MELWEYQRSIKPQNLAVNLGPCRTKSYGHSSPAFHPRPWLPPAQLCTAPGCQAWRAEPSGAAAAQSASHTSAEQRQPDSKTNSDTITAAATFRVRRAHSTPYSSFDPETASSFAIFLLLALLTKRPKALPILKSLKTQPKL